MVTENVYRADLPVDVRRITIALQTEWSFHVGQQIIKTGLEITRITREEGNALIFGMMMYKIFAKKLNTPNADEFVWKHIEGIPVMVEYSY